MLNTPIVTRRDLFRQTGMGLGMLALADLMHKEGLVAEQPPTQQNLGKAGTARSVISLFMHGGPSQVDTFDPKPMLSRYEGQTLPASFGSLKLEFTNSGSARILPSRRLFRKCGSSGIEMSDIFQHLPEVADEMAVIRSCYHSEFNHAPALYLTHSGTRLMGRPSLGAWSVYGLGSESENLPSYVVLRDGPLKGGPGTYGNGFLPGINQPTEFRSTGSPILYLNRPDSITLASQRRILQFTDQLNRQSQAAHPDDPAIAAKIASYELAYRMQSAAPEALELNQEPEHIKAMYGMNDESSRAFGTQCLNARRLVERGVRFVQLYHGGGGDGWDTHSSNDAKHVRNGQQIDKPITGLIKDLKARGLLDSTLVIWGGEFGRTPTSEGSDGRDHSPYGYTVWMAGGGIKGGTIHGATDDFGFKAERNPVQVRDLHATILFLLGLDHNQLTYYFQGLEQKLTQVDGESRVIREIVA